MNINAAPDEQDADDRFTFLQRGLSLAVALFLGFLSWLPLSGFSENVGIICRVSNHGVDGVARVTDTVTRHSRSNKGRCEVSRHPSSNTMATLNGWIRS